MSTSIVALMLGVSTLLGAFGLLALLWGHKTGQFEDMHKFLDASLYDGEEELRDAILMEQKQKEAKEAKEVKEKEKRADKRVMPD